MKLSNQKKLSFNVVVVSVCLLLFRGGWSMTNALTYDTEEEEEEMIIIIFLPSKIFPHSFLLLINTRHIR